MNQRYPAARRGPVMAAALLLALALGGCGSASEVGRAGSAAPSPRASSAPETPAPGTTSSPPGPTPAPAAPSPANTPPKEPTDQVGPGPVVGTLTAASGGPCYTLVTDDGEEFNVYSAKRIALEKAQRVTARLGPPATKPQCPGGGRQATAVSIVPLA